MVIDLPAYLRRLADTCPPGGPRLGEACSFVNSRLSKRGSVLEEVFLLTWVWHHVRAMMGHGFISYNGERLPGSAAPTDNNARVDLRSQVKIGRDRVDFLVSIDYPGGRPALVVIECDGHNFHDRTAKQASADRARDRRLLRQGYVTLRYTFSDICERPSESISDLWETVVEYSRAVQPAGVIGDRT